MYHYASNNPLRYIDPDGRENDYFTSTTYDTYEIAISEVQKYVTDNYNGKEFAGLIEVNEDGKYFFKIKEGEEHSTTWGYALMDSTDEINNVKCVFHSHPSRKQELEDKINQDFPNASNLQITSVFGHKHMNDRDLYGFFYVGIFIVNDNLEITRTYSAAISDADIYNSTIHPEIPSLVFSPDIDEYCIILNGQILRPTRN